MQIMIQRGSEQFGPYTLEQVQTFLADGSVAETDFAWYEGLSEWQPISSLFNIEKVSHPTPPPPPPATGKTRKGRSKAEKIFWTIFLIGGALFGLIVFVYNIASFGEEVASASTDRAPRISQAKEKPKPRREQPSPTSVLDDAAIEEVDLFDLQETHSKNSLYFDETYRGKTLRVTGEIAKIDRKLIVKTPYVNLQAAIGGRKFIEDLTVVFDDSSLAAKLTTGTIITVVGRADGVNEMRRPQIRDAVIESVRTPMEPYPGIVWEHEGETRNPLSADSSQVIHAAKLFVISLENPLIAKDISGTQNHKLAELTRFESRGNKALYRIGMYFEDARKLKTLYSWVMVTENSDGSYETPPEGHFMGDFVALCGIDPSGFDIAQARKRIRDANGWTD